MRAGRRLAAALAACAAAVLPAVADSPPDLRAQVRDAFAAFERQEMAGARAAFTDALTRAQAEGDAWAAAEAARGLGRVHIRTGRYAEADAALQRALDGFLEVDDPLGAARCVSHLGSLAMSLGQVDDARGGWSDVLPEFERLGAQRDQAETLFNLGITSSTAEEERTLLGRAESTASSLGLPQLEGKILLAWGDFEHEMGDYGAAQGHLEQAAHFLEEAGAKGDLALVYNALSRIERVHQRIEEAIALDEKALVLQEKAEDLEGAIQSLDHLADAYGDLGRHRRALALYARALALARKTGAASNIDYVRGRTADAYVRQGDSASAARLLEGALAGTVAAEQRPRWLTQLGGCYVRLGRAREGLAAAEQALDLLRPTGRRSALLPALRMRAYARAELGQLDTANADLQEELNILEEVRGRLSPRDFLKRGFAEQYKSTFAQAVVLLDRAGRKADALETAERARARAFVDLLAARRPDGTAAAAAAPAPAGAALPSPATAAAATLAQVTATARRLDSTVVSYFVTDLETFIWVVDASGLRAAVRRPIGARALALLVDQAAPDVEAAPPPRASGVQIASRGGGLLLTGERVRGALRRLYTELVAPVRRSLPHTPGARLTLIPHGPLARLPFAALIDGRGRYLLESFTLHAAPAAAVFDFTAGAASGERGALFVADPARFPAGRPPLAALPATRDEVTASSGALAPGASSLLLGADATEANVRARWAQAGVIHFATHAVVRDDEPFESFLALQPGRGGAGDDGRLTAGEVQGLPLHASLVVLSACSTGRGPNSADGIVGLTRAFFTAGASSVVATLWDVPDGPSARVMAAFYRGLARGGTRDRALRAAQLDALRALRAGRLTVPFAGRTVVLPEHPALWAGFVLLGEP